MKDIACKMKTVKNDLYSLEDVVLVAGETKGYISLTVSLQIHVKLFICKSQIDCQLKRVANVFNLEQNQQACRHDEKTSAAWPVWVFPVKEQMKSNFTDNHWEDRLVPSYRHRIWS